MDIYAGVLYAWNKTPCACSCGAQSVPDNWGWHGQWLAQHKAEHIARGDRVLSLDEARSTGALAAMYAEHDKALAARPAASIFSDCAPLEAA